MNTKLQNSELVLNEHQRVYHLNLAPGDIGRKIILVGDPERVQMISSHFDEMQVERRNREFVTHTGMYKGERISAIATGIGTDNIDIVLNELDALQSIDLETRAFKTDFEPLVFVRIGTSGAMQADIEVNEVIVGEMALGLDNVPAFYANFDAFNITAAEMLFYQEAGWGKNMPRVYFVQADEGLLAGLGKDYRKGITVSAPGFYGPQGRRLRLPLKDNGLNSKMAEFSYKGLKITNYEMESSALYALAKLMGHKAITLCKIIANRATKDYNPNYKNEMDRLITITLERLRALHM